MSKVPGSIPKMIFELFCNVKVIFDALSAKNVSQQQKYQINLQLCYRAFAGCVVVLLSIPAGKGTA